MTAVTTITLLILAAASLAFNGYQWAERRAERRDANAFIAKGARMEVELDKTKSELANEVNHREWAIGRIKDQQVLISGLRNALKAASKDRYKKWLESSARNEDNDHV